MSIPNKKELIELGLKTENQFIIKEMKIYYIVHKINYKIINYELAKYIYSIETNK